MDISRYEKQSNAANVSLKFKLKLCRKDEVLLSYFDSNAFM